jgi:Ser/Thr protein kinase RdoA (MazF antagonist)
MDPVVRSVLAETLASDVRATELAPTGNSKRTVFATLADGREVVVQHATGDELATETALWRAVDARTDVPVADILAAGETIHPETGARHSYVVGERVDGVDLHTAFTELAPPDRDAVARTLGRSLGELHAAFPFERYGEVVATGAGLRVREASAATTSDWQAWFADYLQAGLAGLGPELADLVPEVRAAVDLERLPEHPPATLFPWDLRPGNAILDERTGEVAALLDWGAPLAADPALSLAKAEYLVADWYAPDAPDAATADRVREAFRDGYAEHRPVPGVSRAYRLAAVVRSAYDSRGEVTRPGYPEREGEAAVAFHRRHLRAVLGSPADREPEGETTV